MNQLEIDLVMFVTYILSNQLTSEEKFNADF
jgi:hypothetical protein